MIPKNPFVCPKGKGLKHLHSYFFPMGVGPEKSDVRSGRGQSSLGFVWEFFPGDSFPMGFIAIKLTTMDGRNGCFFSPTI